MHLSELTILAVVQGIVEFLPISSSGHLMLVERLLNCGALEESLQIALHGGTSLAILFYYRRKIWELIVGVCRRRGDALAEAGQLAISSIPVVLAYLLLRDALKGLEGNLAVLGSMMLVTGVVLLSLRWRPPACGVRAAAVESGDIRVGWWRALVIGVAQACALLPGISRLGMTVVGARRLGVPAERATRFSFMMNLPLLAGSALLGLSSLERSGGGMVASWREIASVTAIAAVVGYLALRLLIRTLSGPHFWVFGIYCTVMGTLLLYRVL